GFGNTEMPDPSAWDYTVDHLAVVVEAAMEAIGFTGPMGFYMPDYGGPIGHRLIEKHPDWLAWQVIQNANSYEEGFTAVWDGIRKVLWANRSPETEAPLEAFLEHDTVKAIYLTGHPDPAKISPDNWNVDLFFLARPPARAPRPAGPVLRLPHQRRPLPGVARAPSHHPAQDDHLLGPGRHLLHPRGRRRLPAGPPRGQARQAAVR